MFTVKATYRNETRKFTISSHSFPSFSQLYNQLYRIFPLSHDYYLSKLLFSPESSSPARILLGREVHSAEDYDNYIKQYKGQYFESALLRFTVFDETPHKLPSSGPVVKSPQWRKDAPNAFHPLPLPVSDSAREAPTVLPAPISFSHIPPPPIIFSSMTHAPMDVDPSASTNSYLNYPSLQFPQHQQQSPHSGPRPAHCCDTARAKSEVQSLLSVFKADLDRILTSTFGSTAPFVSQYSCASSCQNNSLPVIPVMIPSTPDPYASGSQASRPDEEANCIACGRTVPGLSHRCQSCGATKCFSCNVFTECSPFVSHVWLLREGYMSWSCVPQATPAMANPNPPSSSNSAARTPQPGYNPVYPSGYYASQNFPTSAMSSGGLSSINQLGWLNTQVPPPPAVSSPPRSPTPPPVPPPPRAPTPPVHYNVSCDGCGSVVVGTRHKCLDCHDYDLCDNCFDNGQASEHNPFHEFIDIREPGRVVVHTVYSGAGEMNSNQPTRGQNATPAQVPPPTAAAAPTSSTPEPAVHNAACNLCDSRIIGDRYKCLSCPDFDTCGSCFSITTEQHPGHNFIKIHKPSDVVVRRNTFRPQHGAICDGCNTTIYGARYKCMHPDCPDFDLCEQCEAHPIPMHNSKHPLLKVRSPDVPIPRRATPATGNHVPLLAPAPCRSPAPPLRSSPVPTCLETLPTKEHMDERISSPVSIVHSQAPFMSPDLSRPQSPQDLTSLDVNSIDNIGLHSPMTDVSTSTEGISQNSLLARWEPLATTLKASYRDKFDHLLNFNDQEKGSSTSETTARFQRSINRSLTALLNDVEGPSTTPPNQDNEFKEVLKKMQDLKRESAIALDEISKNRSSPKASPQYVFGSIQGNPFISAEESEQSVVSLADAMKGVALTEQSPVKAHEDRLEAKASMKSSSVSLSSLLNGQDGPITRTASLSASISRSTAQSPVSFKSAEEAPEEPETTGTSETQSNRPSATVLADVTVQDGQVFPPGAEFVKAWKVKNDGKVAWPAGTEVAFVGGCMLGADVMTNPVGDVQPGAEVEVWTRGLKAPDVPGRYVSYWTLRDDDKIPFGGNIWVDIIVEDRNNESLSSSSLIIMPHAATTATTASRGETCDEALSDDGSISLVSMPSSSSGSSDYEDARKHGDGPAVRRGASALEYVVLYDEGESDSE